MAIFLNILAVIGLFVFQGWIVSLVGMVTISFLLITPVHYMQRGMDSTEEYAAEHPWRVHLVSFAFTSAKVAAVLIEYALVLWLLIWILGVASILNPTILYVESFLIFLSALNNAWRGGKSVYNSLSFRLKGGSSEFRTHHGQRHLPPDGVLPPITPVRHGW